MNMTMADITDAVATANMGTRVASAEAWTTLYTRDKVPAQARPKTVIRPHAGWDHLRDDSTHDPRMESELARLDRL